MEGQLAVPFHFAAEFLILAVCAGATFVALRGYRTGAGGPALVQAAGFAALAGAQIAHGALLAQADGARPLIALRAVGFGLLAASLRPLSIAGAPAIFLAGQHAGWGLVSAVAAGAVAIRAFVTRREEPAWKAIAGAFACFAAGEAALAAGAPAGGLWLSVSHGVRAAGALLLGRWLWVSMARSVRLRFVAAIVASLVLLATIVSAALTQVVGNDLQREELSRLAGSGRGQVTQLDHDRDSSIRGAGTLAELLSQLRSPKELVAGISAGIYQRARALVADADFLVLIDAQGKVFDSAHEVAAATPGAAATFPPLDGVQQIAIAGTTVVQRALGGPAAPPAPAGDVVSIGLDQVAVIGASPIQAEGRRLLGVAVVGRIVDRRFLLGLHAEADITILKGGEIVSTTFEHRGEAAGLRAGNLRRRVRRQVEEQGSTLTTVATTNGQRSFAAYSPVRSDDGRIVAVLVMSRPAGLIAGSQRSFNRTLFLITLAASVMAALIAWLLSGRVTRPIRALTRAARQVRTGDLDVRAAVDAPDEIGTLGSAFNEMATSLKRMTDDLRGAATEEANLRARMEAIMQSMGDALVATDVEGSVVMFNRAAENMLGHAGEQVVGRRLSDVLFGMNGTGRALAEVALSGTNVAAPGTVEGRGGRRIPVALTAAPLRDGSGETVGRVVVLRDVSREHEAERMKSEFLSNVSHELRTPLTPIKGYTEILRRKTFPREKTQGFLDGIMDSTKRLERIVEILVDFAAMEAGRLKPTVSPLDLRSFIGEIIESWRDRIDGKHRLVRKVPADLPPTLADERLLRKCLDELIDNAVKFSPDGGTIEIEAAPVSPNGRRGRAQKVRVMVRDRGIGIAPEQIDSLFRDFRQLDGSETRSYGGLGLGLAYAKRLALAHHGDITVESVPGRGSTFSVVLPIVAKQRGAAAAAPARRTAARTRPAAKPRNGR